MSKCQIEGLTIIAERLSHGNPSVKKIMNTHDITKIQQIAQAQKRMGANYINLNVGVLPAEKLVGFVKAIQDVVDVPLCLDDPNPEKLEAALDTYDINKSNGKLPILNSATEARADAVLSLRQKKDCQVVLMVTERGEGSSFSLNLTGEEAYRTAKRLFYQAQDYGFQPNQVFIDPGMCGVGADYENHVNRVIDTLRRVHSDPKLKEAHTLVGLTNFTHDLPSHIQLPLQNAFLTLVQAGSEDGLDTIIGNLNKEYRILDKDDKYFIGLKSVLNADGFERLECVRELY